MKGTMTIIKVDGTTEVKTYDGAPQPLEDLNAAVGGWIELIPYFDKYKGEPCIAYCNEEGKLDGLSFNEEATLLWEKQIGNPIDDILVGNVAIIQGDKEFMEAQ